MISFVCASSLTRKAAKSAEIKQHTLRDACVIEIPFSMFQSGEMWEIRTVLNVCGEELVVGNLYSTSLLHENAGGRYLFLHEEIAI